MKEETEVLWSDKYWRIWRHGLFDPNQRQDPTTSQTLLHGQGRIPDGRDDSGYVVGPDWVFPDPALRIKENKP